MLAYKGARDFAACKSSLTLNAVLHSVGLSASLGGTALPVQLSKLTASKTFDAGGVQVLAEPSFVVKAKEAALKLVATKSTASLTVEAKLGGGVSYTVRALGATGALLTFAQCKNLSINSVCTTL
eukprot:scaffold192849_cov32-Tisochrysis_lutea.AAC.2